MLTLLNRKIIELNVKSIYEISFVNLIILLFIYRTVSPFFKYPFIILYSIFITYYLIKFLPTIKIINIKKKLLIFFPIFILTIFIVMDLFFTKKLHLIILKDLFNILILISLLVFMVIRIKTKKQLNLYISNFIVLSIFFSIVSSVVLLGEFIGYSASTNDLSQNNHLDYNFATIPVFIGIIIVLSRLKYVNKNSKIIILNLLLIFLSISILLSGSRRGIILILILIVFLFIGLLLRIFNKNLSILSVSYNIRWYLFFLFIFVCLITSFFIFVPASAKNETLRFIGVKDITKAKKAIFSKINKYTFFISNAKLYDIVWPSSFDPKDPDSGWGKRNHKTIFPLPLEDENIRIPKGTKGYFMDSNCNADTWDGNAYSFTTFAKDSIYAPSIIKASVYCFVSNEFDGTWVRLMAGGQTYSGIRNVDYDLSKKGKWQKLSLKTLCKEGTAPVILYFAKYGVTDFSTLKGHVIFAYPQYKVIKKDSLKNEQDTSIIKEQSYINVKNDYINQQFHQINFKEKYNYQKAGILDFKILKNRLFYQTEDSDPIRNWVAKIVAEDTTYYPYHADLKVDSISDNFIAPRTARWQFAWQIFTKEYNWAEKIFGGGFDFLNWYGYYFLKDKTKSDWPHNPFLSVLLYSGILGLLLYLFFLYRVFYLYIKYIKEYYLLFIFFLICFYFSFFSAGHPFDPPVTGFFAMLPFLIHAVHKKEKENSDKQTNL